MISKVAWIVLGSVLGIIIGVIAGLWFGMFLGGNFFTNVSWMGMVGYELFGTLGVIVGAILGLAVGLSLVIKKFDERKNN
jgi:hypothetical protein